MRKAKKRGWGKRRKQKKKKKEKKRPRFEQSGIKKQGRSIQDCRTDK
jgi:hypothetical protein